jgi:outer membrane protein assembly factor BamC
MITRFISLFLVFIFFTACSSVEDLPIIDKVTQPDYVSSKKAKKLEVPPDLSEVSTNNTYQIEGRPTSYKDFEKQQAGTEKLIKNENQIRVVKSGNMRWLVINGDYEAVWSSVESFWEDMGFRIAKDSKITGILETEWLSEAEINKDKGGLEGFDAWLDALANTSTKRKFRTRIEKGSDEGTVEVYLSQRSLLKGLEDHQERKKKHYEGSVNPDTVYQIQEYKADDADLKKKTDQISNFKEDDLEINYELLRRLMVKLGTSDLAAKGKLDGAKEIKKAELLDGEGYKYIQLLDSYQRSWRKLSLAIDMVGFEVVDKNRSKGIFYIKYSNLEIDENSQKKKNKKGIIDKLAFWNDDEEKKSDDAEGQEKYKKELQGEEGSDKLVKKEKSWSEKTWEEKLPFLSNWGDDHEEGISKDEKRYRVRLLENAEGSKVFIDYPDETINKTKTAQSVVNIIYEYLK